MDRSWNKNYINFRSMSRCFCAARCSPVVRGNASPHHAKRRPPEATGRTLLSPPQARPESFCARPHRMLWKRTLSPRIDFQSGQILRTKEKSDMSKIIGIDLGTSNSAAAVLEGG